MSFFKGATPKSGGGVMNPGLDYVLWTVCPNDGGRFRKPGLDYRSGGGFMNQGQDYKGKAGATLAPRGSTASPERHDPFVPWSTKPFVNCGNHLASSCAGCPKGNG